MSKISRTLIIFSLMVSFSILSIFVTLKVLAQAPPYTSPLYAAFGGTPPINCNNGNLFYNVITFQWFGCGPIGNWNFIFGGNNLVGDAQYAQDGVVNGTTLLVSASANFQPSDTGKNFICLLCNTAGTTLAGTFTYVNSTTVAMSIASPNTATGRHFYWGTDNTKAVTLALATYKGKQWNIPSGKYMYGGITLPDDGTCTNINGENQQSTWLILDASPIAAIFKGNLSKPLGCSIRNLTLHGGVLTNIPIFLYDGEGWIIENLTIEGAGAGGGGEGMRLATPISGFTSPEFYGMKLTNIEFDFEEGYVAPSYPKYGLHLEQQATNSKVISDIVCINCVTAGVQNDGSSNYLENTHAFGNPVSLSPAYNINEGHTGGLNIYVGTNCDIIKTACMLLTGNGDLVMSTWAYWNSALTYPSAGIIQFNTFGAEGIIIDGITCQNQGAMSATIAYLGATPSPAPMISNQSGTCNMP